MITLIKQLKKCSLVDLNQREMGKNSKAKLICFSLLLRVPPPRRVLDLGCRDGAWSQELKKRGYDVVSADLRPSYEGAIQMDADKPFPFRDREFDMIWSTEVIEHLHNPKQALSEMRRIVKPGGVLILTTPNSYFWFFKLLVWVGAFFGRALSDFQNPDHKQFFSYRTIRTLFPHAEIYGFFPYFGPLRFTTTSSRIVSFFSPVFVIYEQVT